ncbi:nucleotide sugar dehydrogenase [Biformimicrobium ophioploci]|uniref:Nucleotide sugar dehydrogenase n=1 Tax=Biformimicrobium ophioploci TaxID=3036711 RepID=A0ABQ6M081_9GAMM|nr:UDP binding domain-containing protein [Microbulbifer sp. NKW57]GMG87750.1 nucleotide sugar dehydrogenase [Microbulbifer sp. NKW57]
MKHVAVIGLGYVGLPLASLCAVRGYRVLGFDKKHSVIDSINSGQCHFRDKNAELLFSEAMQSGNFEATSQQELLTDASIYIICVPTPVDSSRNPDLSPLLDALEVVGPHLERGDLVVIESTVFPGTCEDVVAPRLAQLSNLTPGRDFFLSHCPERINPGDAFWHCGNIPRVVGALSDQGARQAALFYADILGGDIFDVRTVRAALRPKFRSNEYGLQVTQVPLGSITMMRSIRDAEAVKAMENTVRDVNIAFVNELAKISDALKLDVVDIINGMATKPFGKGPFYPGVGVGGHCIAVDPEWLKMASRQAGFIPEIIELARATNTSMPTYTVQLLQDLLNERGMPVKGTQVAILGTTYKRDTDDLRESPFYPLRDILKRKGASLRVFDSWNPAENTHSDITSALHGAKAAVIVTDHTELKAALSGVDFAGLGIEVVIDGRNCLDPESFDAESVIYKGIGR